MERVRKEKWIKMKLTKSKTEGYRMGKKKNEREKKENDKETKTNERLKAKGV